MVLLAACSPDEPPSPPVRLQTTIAFPPKDTFQLGLPALTRWCSDRQSILIESLSPEGSGVMMRLRYRDSLHSDSFPIVLPDDTGAVPAATVALRFFVDDTPHGYTLDSGGVHVERTANAIVLSGTGVGVEKAMRMRAWFESEPVPLGTDSVPCNYSP
ncbi:MAG TPA: hypothetical protein VFM23_09670 [Gemmatimonadales bacterium]|nr:hypothetical protein [Gemmatimonadales bacterium]